MDPTTAGAMDAAAAFDSRSTGIVTCQAFSCTGIMTCKQPSTQPSIHFITHFVTGRDVRDIIQASSTKQVE